MTHIVVHLGVALLHPPLLSIGRRDDAVTMCVTQPSRFVLLQPWSKSRNKYVGVPCGINTSSSQISTTRRSTPIVRNLVLSTYVLTPGLNYVNRLASPLYAHL